MGAADLADRAVVSRFEQTRFRDRADQMGAAGELDPDIVAGVAAEKPERIGANFCSDELVTVITALATVFGTASGALLAFDKDFEFASDVPLNKQGLCLTACGGEFVTARLLLRIPAPRRECWGAASSGRDARAHSLPNERRAGCFRTRRDPRPENRP
jgi:hypothetical protein